MIVYRIIFYILSLCYVHSLQAAEQGYLDGSLSTPRAAVMTHINSLQLGNSQYKVAAKVFSQKERNEQEALKLSIKLKEILEEKVNNIHIQDIPDDPDYIDPEYQCHRYLLVSSLPKVYLVKANDQWIYSEDTAHYIASLAQTHQLGSIKNVANVLPTFFLKKAILGLYRWQIVAMLLIVVLLVAIYRGVVSLYKQLFKLLIKSGIYEEIISLAEPLSLILLACTFRLLLWCLELPSSVYSNLIDYTKSVLWFFFTMLCYKLVDVGVSYIYRKTVDKKIDFNLVLLPMIKVSSKVLIVILGFLGTLQSLDFDIKGLLTGVGIGGLGFALASQDTIKNLFGSLVILTDKPFDVGDMIVSGNIEGRVEEIGFRSTRIHTSNESIIYVPNGRLADAHINNYGVKQYKEFTTIIAIAYNTPLVLIESFIEGLRKLAEHHPSTREGKQQVYLHDLKEARLEIAFEVKFSITDGSEEKQVKHDLLLNIIKLAETLHLPFAFPTQTVHMETFPEKKPNTPPYITDAKLLKERLQNFFLKKEP